MLWWNCLRRGWCCVAAVMVGVLVSCGENNVADAWVWSRTPLPLATRVGSNKRLFPQQRPHPLLLRYPTAKDNTRPTTTTVRLQSQASSWIESYGHLLEVHPLTTKAITSSLLAWLGDAIAQGSSWLSSSDEEKRLDLSMMMDDYDLPRGLTYFCFGAAYTGAFQHVWFHYLGTHVMGWGEHCHIWGPSPPPPLPQTHTTIFSEWWTTTTHHHFEDDSIGLWAWHPTPQHHHLPSTTTTLTPPPPSDVTLALAKLIINQFGMVPFVYMPLFFYVTGKLHDSDNDVARAYGHILARNYLYWLPVQFGQFFWCPPAWQIPFCSLASLVWTIILSTVSSSSSSSFRSDGMVPSPSSSPRPR